MKKGRTSSLRNLARADWEFGIKPERFFTEPDNFKLLALEGLPRFPFNYIAGTLKKLKVSVLKLFLEKPKLENKKMKKNEKLVLISACLAKT